MLATYTQEFLLIATIHLVAVASPGPDFALIVKQSVKYGRRTAFFTSLGIGSGILIHVFYSLLGLSVVISSDPFIYQLLHYIAAGYFIYIGIKNLTATANQYDNHTDKILSGITDFKAFTRGFLVNGVNIKVTLFFISLFTLVIDQSTPVTIKFCYGVYMSVATILWFSMLSALLTKSSVRAVLFERGYLIERLMGVILIVVALQILRTGIAV